MIQINVNGILSDIKWLPNGNLLGFGSFEGGEGNSAKTSWTFWLWSSQTWSQVEGFVSEPGPGAFATNECRIEMDPSGTRFILRGAYDCWFSIADDYQPKRIPLPMSSRWQMSPTEKRFFTVRQVQYRSDNRLVTEVAYGPSISSPTFVRREIEFNFGKHGVYFYGPTGQSIFIGRTDPEATSPSLIDQYELHFNLDSLGQALLLQSTELNVQYLRTMNSISSDLVKVWHSVDWRYAILGYWRHQSPSRSYGFLNLETPNDVVRLEGLDELGRIEDICFHPSNRYLGIVVQDCPIAYIYDLVSQTVIRRFDWRSGNLRSMDFSYDGSMLAAIARGDTVIVWDVDF